MKSSCFVANASPLGRWDAMGPKLPKRLSHLSCITLRLASRTSERPNVLLFSCACCRNVLNEDEESGKVPLHHSCSTGAKHWDTHPPTPPPLPLSLLLCSTTHQYNIGASDVYARPLHMLWLGLSALVFSAVWYCRLDSSVYVYLQSRPAQKTCRSTGNPQPLHKIVTKEESNCKV